MEALEQEQAQADEDRPHDQRAYDAPEERTMMQRRGDACLRENHYEQEEVVDRQRFLEQISGQVGDSRVASQAHCHEGPEQKAQADPYAAP